MIVRLGKKLCKMLVASSVKRATIATTTPVSLAHAKTQHFEKGAARAATRGRGAVISTTRMALVTARGFLFASVFFKCEVNVEVQAKNIVTAVGVCVHSLTNISSLSERYTMLNEATFVGPCACGAGECKRPTCFNNLPVPCLRITERIVF